VQDPSPGCCAAAEVDANWTTVLQAPTLIDAKTIQGKHANQQRSPGDAGR
jgi:hypothetical protein